MRLFIAAAAIVLTGCSHVNTGQIDYRVADSSPARAVATQCAGEASRCVPLRSRYLPASDDLRPFAPDEVYSMEIEQIVIGDNILEGVILGKSFDGSGEFAVLANVFEFAGNEADAGTRRFLQSDQLERAPADPSDVELKLVYYGDDVHRFQPLNMSNIPLKPRSAYGGGSIGIQLAILEVDTRSGPMASLLTTLARFGQQAIPVSSEVSDVLFDLGESLFAGGSGDDRLFEYRFVMSRASDDDDVQAGFAPGRYVLRRTENRVDEQEWDDLWLDLNTGRLMRDAKEVRDELYIVVNVRRYPEGTAPEHYQLDGWSSVREKLSKADPVTTPLNQLTNEVGAALVEERSDQWLSRLFARWGTAEARLRSLTARHVPNLADFDTSACATVDKDRTARLSDQAERNARDALREFVAEYVAATRVPPAGASAELSGEDREAVVSRVARYFMPWSGGTDAHFVDASAFDPFVRDSAAGLAPIALKFAKENARDATGCNDLAGAI